MDWEQAQRRILDTLEEIGHQRGLRTMHEIEDFLGVYRGFLRKTRTKSRLAFSQLIGFLEALEIAPARFMCFAFWDSWPEIDPIEIFSHFSEAAMRKSSEGEGFFHVAWDVVTGDTSAWEDKLVEVDRLSFSSPKKAATLALNLYRKGIEQRDLYFTTRAAAARSSSLRFHSQIDAAQALLWRAMITIQDRKEPRWQRLYADLLRRATYIACESNKPILGMKLAESAIETSGKVGDLSGIGRGLAVHGTAAGLGGTPEVAISSLRSATFWLEDEDSEYLLTCRFNLALELSKIERYEEALEILDDTSGLPGRGHRKHFRGRFGWLRARIARALGNYHESEEHYLQAYDNLRLFPVDATLVCTEVLELYLAGNLDGSNAGWLQRFLGASFAVTKSPAVDEAIGELVRAAEVKGLSSELLKKIREELERRRELLSSL